MKSKKSGFFVMLALSTIGQRCVLGIARCAVGGGGGGSGGGIVDGGSGGGAQWPVRVKN